MVNDLRRDLYSQIQRLSLSFHTRQQIGDLMYRITADTMGIQTLTMNGFFASPLCFGPLAGMLVVMLSLDSYLTLLAMAVCPALFVAIALLNKKMSSAAAHARQKESLVYSLVQRTLSGIRVIQAFTKEEDEERRFVKASTESLAADLRLYNLQNFYYAVVNVTIAAGTAAVLWLGTRHVLSGRAFGWRNGRVYLLSCLPLRPAQQHLRNLRAGSERKSWRAQGIRDSGLGTERARGP